MLLIGCGRRQPSAAFLEAHSPPPLIPSSLVPDCSGLSHSFPLPDELISDGISGLRNLSLSLSPSLALSLALALSRCMSPFCKPTFATRLGVYNGICRKIHLEVYVCVPLQMTFNMFVTPSSCRSQTFPINRQFDHTHSEYTHTLSQTCT